MTPSDCMPVNPPGRSTEIPAPPDAAPSCVVTGPGPPRLRSPIASATTTMSATASAPRRADHRLIPARPERVRVDESPLGGPSLRCGVWDCACIGILLSNTVAGDRSLSIGELYRSLDQSTGLGSTFVQGGSASEPQARGQEEEPGRSLSSAARIGALSK